MNEGYLLQNAAGTIDGVELRFEGDKCGKSYKVQRNCIKTWDLYFYDWHEGGWIELRGYGGWKTRHEAIQGCNKHAVENRLIKFLPNRPKFKLNPTWFGMGSAIGQAASICSSVAGLSI